MKPWTDQHHPPKGISMSEKETLIKDIEELEEKCRYYRRKVNEIKAHRGLE